jgi:hypothetical protein
VMGRVGWSGGGVWVVVGIEIIDGVACDLRREVGGVRDWLVGWLGWVSQQVVALGWMGLAGCF